jgi:excinuclease ABC subunit A
MSIISIADHIIDMGPEGGNCGGKIIATGTPREIIKTKISRTGKYLNNFRNCKNIGI